MHLVTRRPITESDKPVPLTYRDAGVDIDAGDALGNSHSYDVALAHGGSPVATVNSAEVIQLQWDFEWADTMTPYEVDVTLDDVMMVQ